MNCFILSSRKPAICAGVLSSRMSHATVFPHRRTGLFTYHFLYAFFPFIFGLYPYTVVTDKQREAMKEAGISYVYMGTYDMAYSCIRTLLGGLQKSIVFQEGE